MYLSASVFTEDTQIGRMDVGPSASGHPLTEYCSVNLHSSFLSLYTVTMLRVSTCSLKKLDDDDVNIKR